MNWAGWLQIRRMPAVDSEKRLVGIMVLGDLAIHLEHEKTGKALEEISKPSKPDR